MRMSLRVYRRLYDVPVTRRRGVTAVVAAAALAACAAVLFVALPAGAAGSHAPKSCHHNCPPPPPPPSVCGTKTGPPATYAHVVWIWMENHSYRDRKSVV